MWGLHTKTKLWVSLGYTITAVPDSWKYPHIAAPLGLPWIALRCCGLLPSLRLDIASSVARLAPSSVPNSFKKTFECKGGPRCFFPDKLTDANRLIRLAAGACLDSHWRLRSSSRFFPRCEQRAERGMDVYRRRPPARACDLTPPSGRNAHY